MNVNDRGAALDRDALGGLLKNAVTHSTIKRGVDGVLAASLAQQIRDAIRFEQRDPNFRFDGTFFGPILFPNLSQQQHTQLKFLDFLSSFPELINIERLPTGADKVSLKETDSSQRSLQLPTGDGDGSQLPGKVSAIRTGYLIVDGPSFLGANQKLFAGANQQAKPNWHKVLRFLNQQFGGEWKGRYLIAVSKEKFEAMSRFRSYLEGNGFRVLNFHAQTENSLLDEADEERMKATGVGAQRLLSEIANKQPRSHAFIVSNSEILAPSLINLMESRRDGAKVGLIGLSDFFGPALKGLKGRGVLQYDIGFDIKAYDVPLPRNQPLSPIDFDPSEFL